MTSCGRHLARVDLLMYSSSVNTCQNQVKILYIESPRWCKIGNGKILLINQRLSVPGLFKWFYNEGSGTENITLRTKIFGLLWENLFCLLFPKFQLILICFAFCFQKFQLILTSDWWVMPHFVISIDGAWNWHHRYDNQFSSNTFCIMSRSFRL